MMQLKKKIGFLRISKISFLLLFFVYSFSYAQDSLQIGKEFKLNHSRTYFEGVAGNVNSNLIGVSVQYNKTKVNTLNIEVFNSNSLEKIEDFPIDFPQKKGFTITPEQIVLVGNNICLLAIHHYKKKPIKVLGLYKVQDKKLNLNYITLDSLTNVGEDELEFYKITQNKEETNLVIATTKLSNKRNSQFLKIQEFDAELNLKSSFNKDLPDIRKRMFFFDAICIHNNVYLLSKNALSKGREINERILKNNVFNLWCVNLNSQKLKQIELKLSDKWIVDLKLKPHNLGCVVGGLFSKNSDYQLDGTIAVEVDSEFKIKNHYLTPFSKSTLTYFDKEDKGLTQIRNLKLRDVKVMSENNYAIILEEYYKDVEQYYDPQTETTALTDVFHYGSCLVVWNQQGKVKDIIVGKNQLSTNDGGIYSSIISSSNENNQIVLFYNDNVKNVQVSEEVKQARTGGAFVKPIKTTLSYNGETTSTILSKEIQLKLVPKNGFQLPSNDVYLVLELNKRNQLARIK